MQLDDIALTRCASLLPFLKRIQFDLVSRRFASLSQSVDRAEKVSLTITGKMEKYIDSNDIDVDEEGQQFGLLQSSKEIQHRSIRCATGTNVSCDCSEIRNFNEVNEVNEVKLIAII